MFDSLNDFETWLQELKGQQVGKRTLSLGQADISLEPSEEQRGFLEETVSALGAGAVSTLGAIGGTAEMLGIPGGKTAREYWEQVGQRESLGRPEYLQEGTIWEHPERLADWRWWTRNLAENAPNMAAMMLPGLGAMKGARLLGWGAKAIKTVALAAGWSGAFTVEAGYTYNQAKKEMAGQGYSDQEIEQIATMEGLTVGVINGILEILPFKALFLDKIGAPRIIRRIIRQAWIEGTTETAQEAVNIYVEKLGHKPDQTLSDNIGRLLESGIIGGALGGGAGFTLGRYGIEEEGIKEEPAIGESGSPDNAALIKDIGEEPALKERAAEQEEMSEKEEIRKNASDLLDQVIIEEEAAVEEVPEIEEEVIPEEITGEAIVEAAEEILEEPMEPILAGEEEAEEPAKPIPEVKEPWEMTFGEYSEKAKLEVARSGAMYNPEGAKDFHYKAVQQAIKEGKITSHPDYPELGKVEKKKPPEVKELWEMSVEAFAGKRPTDISQKAQRPFRIKLVEHKDAVKQAIKEGKITSHPDYPELGIKVEKKPSPAVTTITGEKIKKEEIIPFAERTAEEKEIIDQYSKKVTPAEWKKEYKGKEPHWMKEKKPSPLADELIKDLEQEGVKKGNILEIGVGNGHDSRFIAKKAHNVTGIDIAEKAIKVAKEESKGMKNLKLEVGDAEKLQFEPDSLDAVYSVGVLHSTPIRLTFREIYRVLKPGGIAKLFLYTRTKTGSKWFSNWTPGEIKQYAQGVGFKIEKFREGHDTEAIEIPGVEGKVEQETHSVITTFRKPKIAEQEIEKEVTKKKPTPAVTTIVGKKRTLEEPKVEKGKPTKLTILKDKKKLLTEIDKAIEEAPKEPETKTIYSLAKGYGREQTELVIPQELESKAKEYIDLKDDWTEKETVLKEILKQHGLKEDEPYRIVYYDQPIETISFQLDGGAHVFDSKDALKEFRKRVEKTPQGGKLTIKPIPTPKAAPVLKPIAAKSERFEDLMPLSEKGWFTDGHVAIKGKPPKPVEGREIDFAPVQGMIDSKLESAELSYHYMHDPDVGTAVSTKPLPRLGEAQFGRYGTVFKTGEKFSIYESGYINAIQNRYPKATYETNENGTLIVKHQGKAVAVLMPMRPDKVMEGALGFTKEPPLEKEAIEVGYLKAKKPPEGETRLAMAGEKAIGAPTGALAKAQEMLAKGEDEKTVWRETGWMKGPEGKWRWEIDDSGAKITDKIEKLTIDSFGFEDGIKLNTFLEHPALFKAYPNLKTLPIKMELGELNLLSKGLKVGASYSEQGIEIRAKNLDQAKDELFHEIQHAIQEIEGFARGGRPGEFVSKYRQRMWDLMESVNQYNVALKENIGNTEVYNKLMGKKLAVVKEYQELEDLGPLEAVRKYKHLAGEIEAREVAIRKGLTPDFRRLLPPYAAEAIPREDWIIKEGSGTSFSVEPALTAPPEGYKFTKQQQEDVNLIEMVYFPQWLEKASFKDRAKELRLKVKPWIDLRDFDPKQLEGALARWEKEGVTAGKILGAATVEGMETEIVLALNGRNLKQLEHTTLHELYERFRNEMVIAKDRIRLDKDPFFKTIESEANAFADYMVNSKSIKDAPNFIKRIFLKLKRLLTIIRNGLNARGFYRPEDIWGKIRVGAHAPGKRGRAAFVGVALAKEKGPIAVPTLEDIQRIFKGQEVTRTPEGNFTVTTQHHGSVEIRTVDRIDENTVAFNLGYGRPRKPGEKIAGKYEDGRIELRRDLADRWVLTHESYHFMEDAGIISKADIRILQNKIRALTKQGNFTPIDPAHIGSGEDRALWTGSQLATVFDVKSTTGKILLKIRTFSDRLLEAFGIRAAGAIARKIETGRIFESPVSIEIPADTKVADQPFYAVIKEETGQETAKAMEENRSFVNKLFEMGDLARHRISNEVGKLQLKVQELAGKPSRKRIRLGIGYQPKLKRSIASDNLDRAMMVYRDLQNNPEKADKFRKWADERLKDPKTPASRKLSIKKQMKTLDGVLELTDQQKEFVSDMGDLFEDAYKKAKTHKVVQSHRDYYVRRLWNLPKEKQGRFQGVGNGYGFKTFTTAAMPRTFETILDGWMNGYDLKVQGLTSSYDSYMADLVTIIANKAFIQKGIDTKDSNGNSLFSTRQLPGYQALKATGFSVWRWAGKAEIEAEFGDDEALIVDTHGRKFFATPPERIPGAWSVFKDEKAKRPVETFDSIVEANTFARDKGYTRIERNIPKDVSEIFQKQALYAPAPLAEMINKMTATDTWVFKIPVIKHLLRLNSGLKSWILLSSFFHHMAGTRSWIFGVHHGWKKANPVKAYKDGLAKIQANHPLIELGIKNGLTVGELQDWAEHDLRQSKGLTESLVQYLGIEPLDKAVQYGKFKRQKFTDSLFKKFFAGLKAEAFVIEYAHELQKEQEKYTQGKSAVSLAGKQAMPPNPGKIAENVARLINADFGGLHLPRMGRNPTLQNIFRLLLLAPDWTESNFRTVSGMIPGVNETIGKFMGDVAPPPGLDKIYQSFWFRVILRIAGITIISQMLLNGKDETDEFLEEQMFSNRWNKFRWTELDVSRLYTMLGIDTEGQRMTFSLGGHFFDPLKLIDPPRLIKHKGSPMMRIIGALGSKSDWAERPFTAVGELFKTGKTIKKSAYEQKEGFFVALPSITVNQVVNMQPIQLGHLIRYLQGEEDGLTAMMHSMGAAVHKAWRPRIETPIVRAKGPEKDVVFAAIEDLVKGDILHMAPPSRHLMINGIGYEMTREQYERYLDVSSAIVRRKLFSQITSDRWRYRSERSKLRLIVPIIKNARKRVRGKIKKVILRERYRQLMAG